MSQERCEELDWLASTWYMHGGGFAAPEKSKTRYQRIRILKRVYARNPDYSQSKKVERLLRLRDEGKDTEKNYWRRVHNHTVAICEYEITKPEKRETLQLKKAPICEEKCL